MNHKTSFTALLCVLCCLFQAQVWAFEPGETWWVMAMNPLLFAVMLLVAIKIKTRMLEGQMRKIEANVLERTRELSDKDQHISKLMEEKEKLVEDVFHQSRTPIKLLLANLHELKSKGLDITDYVERQSLCIKSLVCLTDEMLFDESKALTGVAKPVEPAKLQQPAVVEKHSEKNEQQNTEDTYRVLLVDDNIEIATYYRDILSAEYNVEVVHSAEQALTTARRELPDIVITDVMKGAMDGYRLAEKFKNDKLTCHIPIVMLTAKACHKARIKGYNMGVNDFIPKPVQPHELSLRVACQLAQVRATKHKYGMTTQINPPIQDKENDPLVDAYIAYIKENFADAGLQTERISEALFVTKKQLERKVKHCLEVTPNHYLITYRLETARNQLLQGYKVKDVYYHCGFSSHAYFSKKFKEKYGYSPSQSIHHDCAA